MRSLRYALFVCLNAALHAQPYPCEASTETAALLAKWNETNQDARLDQEQRMQPLRDALAQHPRDLFLHLRYQRLAFSYVSLPMLPAMDAEYKALYDAHPEELFYRYLYARVLYGWRNQESLTLLEKIVEDAPDFPWARFDLAHHYIRLGLKEKRQEQARKFFELCPATLEASVYRDLYRDQPGDFKLAAAKNLRERIQDRDDAQSLVAYDMLWQLEFEQPPAEHPRLRDLVKRDLLKLRRLDGPLDVLAHGYEITDDRDGARWVREQMALRAPHSTRTGESVLVRWLSDRPRPTQEDSRERVQSFYREMYRATDDWVRQWPLWTSSWTWRLRALRELPDEPAAAVAEAGRGLLEAANRNRFDSGSGIPPTGQVIEALLERNVALDRVPELVHREEDDIAKRAEVNARSEHGFLPKFVIDGDRQYVEEVYWNGQLALLKTATADAAPADAAPAILAAMEKAIAKPELQTDPPLYWHSRTALAEAYVVSGQQEKCASLLAEMQSWITAHKPKDSATAGEQRTHRTRQARYFELMGRLADVEGRTEASLESHQRVIEFRPFWDTLNQRFDFIDRTHALWVRTGKPEDQWQQWLTREVRTIRDASPAWTKLERALPEFELADLSGKTWTLAALKGKRTLINIWATWCGPCRTELPHLQKLYASLKDRTDVQVITWNADEDRSAVAPYMKQEAFTFPVILAREFLEKLGVRGYPTTWIVEPDGAIREEQLGFTGEPKAWLDQLLAKLASK